MAANNLNMPVVSIEKIFPGEAALGAKLVRIGRSE